MFSLGSHRIRQSSFAAVLVCLVCGQYLMAQPAAAVSPELKQIVFFECEFVKRACRLTPAQEQELSKLDNAWIDKIARETSTQRFANGFVRVLGINNNADPALPRAIAAALVRQIHQTIDEMLDQEQRKLLAQERSAREEFKKEAMLDALLICLDRNVGLTEKQRSSLKSDLKVWARGVELHPTSYLINPRFIPNFPNRVLTNHLTSSQLVILNSLQRIDFARNNDAVILGMPFGAMPGMPARAVNDILN